MTDFRDKYRIEEAYGVRETPGALLVEADGDEIWVPMSQIDDDSEVYAQGHEGTLIVNDWWARQKGLV